MKKKTAAQLAWEAQKQAWTSQGGVQVSSTQKTTAAQNAWNSAKNNPDYIQRARQQTTKVKTAAQPTEKIETFDVKRGNLTGEANGRSGRSQKERQERLSGKQMAYQMQKESGISPDTEAAKKTQTNPEWENNLIAQATTLPSAPELTQADVEKEQKKSSRIQKPTADHYDAEQIRQYKEQEIGDYKKVLDEQNTLADTLYKEFQTAEQAVKDAQEAYEKNPNGVTRMRYLKAFDTYQKAREPLSTAVKRSEELANEVNAMIGSYQNQYDDKTRYAGKDYAGMQAYITELADQLDQTGAKEKNAETGQNLREQYQEEIDRATNYSYSMMDMEQLQAEYDRLNRQREELYKPVGPQYRYQATGADRQAAEDRKAEQEKTGEKMRLVQQAMNQLEMNEARGAYEAYAQRKSLGENFGQYGNGNIDLWNVPSLDNIVVWDERRNAEVVIPTTWRENGRVVHTNDPDEAYAHYEKTGKYFGIFATTDEALTYGDQLKTEKAARSTEKPVYDFAGQNLIDVFEEMVNGRKGYKTAGETTEIALRDQVERNMKHLPENAKEVMLQFLEDKDYVSAANYYKAYESTMTANYANAQYAELKDWASQNFGTALGGSIGAGVAGAVTPAGAWIDNTFNAINNKLVDVTGEGTYRFSDVNSDMYRGARTAAALQEGVQAYNATTGKWEDALNLASGALTSSVQNVVQFALFGSASLPFMAASAAGQSAYQGLNSGLSEEQAAVTSTVSGLIEYMTEKLPLEHLLDKINTIGEGGVVTVKQIAEMIRKQGMEEASEEVVGNIADNLFDMWYNKDNSEFRQYSAQLQREGMSKAEADMEAFGKFFVGDSIEAAAAAYLSTFLLIGGNVASANMQAAQYGKEMKAGEAFKGTQYTVDEMNTVLLAQQIPGEYEGGRYAAEQLKNQVLEGKQLSNRMLGFAAMTNNQVIKDASKYMNQAFEMGPETQSFKMAAAMVGQYDVGSQLPSKAFVESLKSQIEADKEAAKQPKTKAKSAQTTTGETLSHYQTVFAENGVGIRDAKNRTEVMNKLILGQSVSDAELRKLHMGAKLTKQMLYELTGVEIPEGVVKEKDLMQYYRSARDGFEAKIKAEAQERTAQDAQAAAEQQRAFEAEQMRQMDIADRVVEATKSDIDERLQYFVEHGKLKEAEKGAENGQTGEAVLRGAGGRADGQSDGGADAAAAGNAEADTRGTEGQNRSGDAGVSEEVRVRGRGNAVSSRDFGLKNATTLKTAREVLQEDETEPMRKFREDVKAKYGYDVVYTDGDFVQRQDGRDVIVRGLFDQESKRLFVNANYFRLSYDQIGNHEVFHIEVANGDVDLQAMAEAFNEATGNKEILDSLVNQYMEKLALDDYNSALEEVFADMNGKFNGIRSVNVTAYQDIFEQIKAASPKNGEAASSMQKNSVESFGDGKQYVKADRQVIFGNDMDSWSTQLEDYINGKIRRGQDVTLIGADGDELILTATSAGKLSSPYTSDGRTMSETAYERKANAAAHIDELAQVSTRGKNNVSDAESRHGRMASEGWNYRTAFFMDFDGKYYKTTISVSQGADGKMIYNIGKMQERSIPQISGSSDANTGAQRRDASSGNRVAESNESVKQKNSEVVDETDRKAHDIDDANGDTISSTEYPRGTHANRVLQDIRNYFNEGITPEVSSAPTVSQFRYSQEADEEYRRLAENPRENHAALQKMVDAAASEAGYTKKAYHGTDGDFWTFSLRNRGKNGEMLGVGYYFAEHEADAANYARGGGKVLPVYLDIQNPVSTTKLTITPEQWGAFLDYAQAHRDEYIDGAWKGNSIKKDFELRYMNDYDSDTDLIAGFINATAGRNSEVAEAYLQMLKDSTGIDGVVQGEGEGKVYVAFTPEQIKSAETVTRNDSGDVIPLSERFNARNGDIRYSVADTLDSDLDKVLSGTYRSRNNELYIGETSNFLTDTIGADALTVTMPPNKAYSAMVTEEQAKADGRYEPNVNYHGLGRDGLLRVLEASENPVVAFADTPGKNGKRANNIVLVTDEVGADGNIVVVEALGVESHLNGKRIDANKIITSYDRAALSKDIADAVADGRLLFADKKRSQDLFAGTPGANSPEAMRKADFKNNIRNFMANVNWENSGRTSYTSGSTEGNRAFAAAYEAAKRGEVQKHSVDSDMTEDERYRELRGKTVAVTPEAKYTDEQLASIHTLEQLNAKAKSKAEKVIRPLAESLGILNRSMKTPDVEIDFTFSKNKGLRESMSKQLRYGGTYADFAKALVNLDGILENAVLIEQHKDKYAGTVRENPYLNSVSVLVGVFRDGDSLIPTQIEIKDTADAGGTLYMTVAMTKIETGVLGSTMNQNGTSRSLIPISSYNLAEIFANVNPADGHFLKYVPDGFLSDAQKAAKQSAIREDANRIQSYRQKNSVDTDLMDVWREQNPGQTTVTQEGLDEAQRTLLDRYRNGTVLRTAYDSVGAAKNSNETQTKTSKARTNTFEKLFSEAEKSMDGLKKEDMTYDVIREKESLEGAAARLAQDFDGEVDDLLKRTDWTGEDLDTAMGALSVFREEAQKNGDYSKVVEMAQKIRENATKGGQFVQAFAKYNRTTPEGLLVKAIDEVDKAKNPVQRKNVNPVVQAMIDSYTEQIRDLRAEQKQAVQDAKLAGQMGQGKADAAELRKIRERYENQIKALNEQRDKLLADAVQAGRESQKKADNAAMKRITDAYNKRIDEWQKKIDLAKAAYDEMFQKGQTQQQQTDARAQERKIQKFEDMLAKLQAERDEILNGGLDALRATNKGISDAKANEITKNLTEMADALDAVKEGDVDALIDVIQRQAKIRKTPVSKATLNNLKKQNFEWLWNAASTQYLQIAKDYVKPSMARRVATYQTMSHLFNKRTGMRNVVSNLAFSAVEAAANDISQIPDMVLGAITGKRGVGFDQAIFSKANWEGFMEGYSKVQPELALDIETAENGKYGTGRRTNKMTGNLLSRNLSRVERLLGYELNLTDEVTKGSIRAETIRQLQGFVDSGKMTMEEAIQAAEQEMLYRTFQDDTLVGTTLSQLKKLGNLVGFGDSGQKIGGLTVHEFGLGDLLTKYTQVPGALVHRSIEFTPAGYAKAIYALVMAQKNGGVKNMSALQQRNIALAIGRATTGSGLIALFAALTKAGIILNADDEDDPDAKALRAAGGISGTQINVDALGRLIRGESAEIQDGDTLLGIEFMQPVNGSMTIGALLNNSKEGQNLAQRWLEAILHGTVQSIDDLSVMNTLRTIQNAIDYSQEDTLVGQAWDVVIELAKSSATGFIPSPVRQFAQGMDAYYRDAYGSKNLLTQGKEQAMNAIPGLRQNLPTKLTNFGEDKTYGGSTVQRWMNAFFTPGSVRTYQADDTVQELLDLYYTSGNEKIIPAKSAPYKIQVGNERYEMSAEERREYQTTMGQTAKLWMEQFFDSEDYAGMTTEERAAQVEKIVKSAEDVAKNKVAGAMGIDNAKVFDQGITVETTRLGLAGESGVSPSLPDSKSIGDPDRTGYKYELTNEELKQWEDLYNGAYTKEVGDVIQSDAYAKADDAEKADMIRDAKETAKNAAKDEFLEALQSVGIRAELDESSDFYEIRKNVTDGTSIEKVVKRLKSDGASENSISSAITSTIKDGYLNGDFNEKTANKKLVQYGAAKDENDAYWKIREWEGGEDYKKYDRFYASVENGKKLDDTISYYTSHGVESKTLKSQITSHFKPLYLSASVQERQYMKEYLLDAYEALGVSRNKAAKNIDKWLEE